MYKYKLYNIFSLTKKTFFISLYCFLFDNYNKVKSAERNLFKRLISSFFRSLFFVYSLKKLESGKSRFINIETKTSPVRHFNAREINSQFQSIYFKQFKYCYEPDITFAIMELLPVKGIFIDIGSNWGHHSFTAALLKSAEVLCFEPNPYVFKDLVEITKQLKLENQISHFCKALSNEKDGKIFLTQNSFESGMASLNYDFLKKILEPSKSVLYRLMKKVFNLRSINYQVELRRLDDYELKKINLIKIDTEGFEINILKGSQKTINACQPFIIFEYFHFEHSGFDEYLSFFKEIDYVIIEVNYELLKDHDNFYLMQGSIIKKEEFNLNSKSNFLAVPILKLPDIKTKLKIF